MQYEVVRDPIVSGNWFVRSVNPDGEGAIASFGGEDAHIAALEYAAWRNEADELATFRSVLFSLQIP
jgi:hypothetical protein